MRKTDENDLIRADVVSIDVLHRAVDARDWLGASAAAALGQAQLSIARATATFCTSDLQAEATKLLDDASRAAETAVRGIRLLADHPPPEHLAATATLRALADLTSTAIAAIGEARSIQARPQGAAP